MREDSGMSFTSLNVDGGAAQNNFLMQFQSDITGTEVHRPMNTETTALGAAYLAGLAVGYWKDRKSILDARAMDRVFKPVMEEGQRERLYKGWKRAVQRSRNWAAERD